MAENFYRIVRKPRRQGFAPAPIRAKLLPRRHHKAKPPYSFNGANTTSPPQLVWGFTLIETILYIALFSLVMSSAILIFYQIAGSQVQNRERLAAEAEAEFLMRKLMWGLTGAQTVSQPALGATSSVLSVSKYNFSQNPLVFDVASGTARLSRGNGAPVVLTAGNVAVTQMFFTHLAPANNQPEGIQIVLSVAASSSERSIIASTTLENTVYFQ